MLEVIVFLTVFAIISPFVDIKNDILYTITQLSIFGTLFSSHLTNIGSDVNEYFLLFITLFPSLIMIVILGFSVAAICKLLKQGAAEVKALLSTIRSFITKSNNNSDGVTKKPGGMKNFILHAGAKSNAWQKAMKKVFGKQQSHLKSIWNHAIAKLRVIERIERMSSLWRRNHKGPPVKSKTKMSAIFPVDSRASKDKDNSGTPDSKESKPDPESIKGYDMDIKELSVGGANVIKKKKKGVKMFMKAAKRVVDAKSILESLENGDSKLENATVTSNNAKGIKMFAKAAKKVVNARSILESQENGSTKQENEAITPKKKLTKRKMSFRSASRKMTAAQMGVIKHMKEATHKETEKDVDGIASATINIMNSFADAMMKEDEIVSKEEDYAKHSLKVRLAAHRKMKIGLDAVRLIEHHHAKEVSKKKLMFQRKYEGGAVV